VTIKIELKGLLPIAPTLPFKQAPVPQVMMNNKTDEHILTLLQASSTAERGFRLLMEQYCIGWCGAW